MEFDLILNFDGSARPNPGNGAYGFIIRDSDGMWVDSVGSRIFSLDKKITSNEAEYHGLIEGLKRCQKLGGKKILVLSDSELIINQFKGIFRIKNHHLLTLLRRAKEIAKQFVKLDMEHVMREYNQEADELARNQLAHIVVDEIESKVEEENVLSPQIDHEKYLNEINESQESSRRRKINSHRPNNNSNSRSTKNPPQQNNRGKQTRPRKTRLPPPRNDFTTAWLEILEKNVGNITYHIQLLRFIDSFDPPTMQLPPHFPPPLPADFSPQPGTSNFNPGENMGTTASASSGLGLSEKWSILDVGDDDDDDDEEIEPTHKNTQRQNSKAKGNHKTRTNTLNSQPMNGANTRNNTHNNHQQSLQFRYIRVQVECSLSEAYRIQAKKLENSGYWDETSDHWRIAYDIINGCVLNTVDRWCAWLHDELLEEYDNHDEEQVEKIIENVYLVQQVTEREKNAAVDRMDQRRIYLDTEMQRMITDREVIRARVGPEKWKSNPNPTNAFAEKLRTLRQEKFKLEEAIVLVHSLILTPIN
jgi:ribonuclease HI